PAQRLGQGNPQDARVCSRSIADRTLLAMRDLPLRDARASRAFVPPSRWLRLCFSPWRCSLSLRRDPPRRRQRCSRPGHELIGFVEQPFRRAPKGEIYAAAPLLVVEGRIGLGFLEDRPVVVVDPK